MSALCVAAQTYTAFAIECDNEFERRMPHQTTRFGSNAGRKAPWLTSIGMWYTCMRFVDERGIDARELYHRARTKTNLHGMQRWGYVRFDRDAKTVRIRATEAGEQARKIWSPLASEIEARWRDRFGAAMIEEARSATIALVRRDLLLPDCVPILTHGLRTLTGPIVRAANESETDDLEKLPLLSLLAKAVVSFAISFESDFPLSYAICANVLRVLGDGETRVRDVPSAAGISPEATAMILKLLESRDYVQTRTDHASRTRVITLTPSGKVAREHYELRVRGIERVWDERFGKGAVAQAARVLAPLADALAPNGRFADETYAPEPNWRARVRRPATLPHYPVPLHRGAFPDGS